MRVATRRQRAAWRVFGDAFDLDRTDRYRRRLKLVAADLGGVRDLDVLIEAGEAYQRRQSAAEATAFEPLAPVLAGPARRRPRGPDQGARQQPLPQVARRLRRVPAGRRRRRAARWDPWTRTASATRCPRASGPPTRSSARTSP